jgi:prevent-host-death family protein
MAISLTQDFKTIEELAKDADGILNQLHETGRPVHITQNGKPAAVVLDVETFERLIKTINFAKLMAPAIEDMLAGRTKPLEQFIEEFESAKKIPGTHHRASRARRAGNS